MLVLVTGLEGFTGSFIQAELENNGHSVVGLKSDITDYKALESELLHLQPEAVIHLAALAFVGHGDANAFYQVNLIGARNLLQALDKTSKRLRSVLLVSSANVYGNSLSSFIDEKTFPNPANDYAVSKLAMEHMANLWSKKIPLCVVRPFNYTGVGQDENFLIPKIVKHFRDNEAIIELGNIDILREFGDVRTVAKIYRQLIEKCPVGETLNVCTGKTYSLREVIALCEKITGIKIKVEVSLEFVRDNEVRELKGNNAKLNKLIGGFLPYTFEETLEWMLNAK